MVLETSIVLTTVADFIDYAMLVVGILAAVYLIRFLLAVRETTAPDRKAKDAEWEARGAAGREWIGKKYKDMRDTSEAEEKKSKAEKEKRNVRNLASPLVDKIYNQIDPLRNVIRTQLIKKERAPALASLKKLKGEIHLLWRQLHSLRHAVSDVKKDEVKDIMNEVDALVHLIETECINEVPKKVGGSWSVTTDPIKDIIAQLDGKVKADLGNFYNRIKSLYS